jgi:hypothetical protein
MKITILVLCLLTSGLMATTFLEELIAFGFTVEILRELVEMEVGELLDLYGLEIADFESISGEEALDLVEMEVGELL